jgi:transposase
VRVSTAFNRLLQIPGASVTDVVIADRDVEVTLRPRARLLVCPCGKRTRAVYDRRRRRWRHLDLGRCRLWLVYSIRRLDCPDCGVITEELPWARPGARHTRDFEDMVLWLAQRTDRTTVSTLMRCGWESVTAIVNRGVADLLDQRRLQTLYRIGVDEICYRHPHRYLTIIGDHGTGTVIDVQPGRSEESLAKFYEQQPDSALSTIEAVSMDVSKAYRAATSTHLPDATICFDPFHIMQWVNRALDRVYAESATGPGRATMSTADWKAGRWALRTGENKLTDKKRDLVNHIARTNHRIGRAWTSKNNSVTSTDSTTNPVPHVNYSRPGSPPPHAAASPHSPHSANAYRNTSKPSSRPSNWASPTHSSKASTPKSASSTHAATATTQPKH